MSCQTGAAHFGQLGSQHLDNLRIFITHIDKGFLYADDMGRDQNPFDHPVRVGGQIMPVFEGAGLALIPIHRQIARPVISGHDPPFPAGGKSGPAQAPQSRGFYD